MPEIAARSHLAHLDRLITKALADANTRIADLDAVAVTHGPGLPGSLLVGLNAAKDFQRSAWNRRSRPLPEDDLMLPATADVPGQAVEDQEALDQLRQAIGQLRQDEKEVFLLRQNGDLTYEQIAEIRSAPVGTVKTQMRTALIKLRKVLNPAGPTEDEPCS